MDCITNSTKDLSESSDEFITSVYKEIAKKIWKSRIRKANLEDDIKNGIDYYLAKGTIQFKELKSDESRYLYNSDKFPFETEVKNKYGQWQKGWVWDTKADYLIFIRTIRPTGEWKCSIYDWKELQPYILANIERSWINRFNSAKNKNFLKKDIEKYLIAEINNS
jgi:hypothetical protein